MQSQSTNDSKENQSEVSIAGEEWRIPTSFTDRYMVSNLGMVKRVPPKIIRKTSRQKVLTGSLKKSGYYQVRLSLGSRKNFWWVSVHILVADAFLGPRPAGLVINHKDGVKTNNAVSNLEYVTDAENKSHAVALGFSCHGAKNCKARLKPEQVVLIRERISRGEDFWDIANDYGVHREAIKNIAFRKTWNREEYL